MASSKAMLFLVVTLLLLTSKVAQGDIPPPTTYPPKTPTTPVVKPPTPVVKPPTPVVKPPTPVVKPPTPVVKPPTPPVTVPPPPYNPPVTVPPLPPPVSVPPTPAPPTVPRQPPVKSLKECGPLCDTRCSLHSRKNVCKRACLTCCNRCKCVPPGTYGNREMCGTCYSQMKTTHDRLKCP